MRLYTKVDDGSDQLPDVVAQHTKVARDDCLHRSVYSFRRIFLFVQFCFALHGKAFVHARRRHTSVYESTVLWLGYIIEGWALLRGACSLGSAYGGL
jgi:hypothetical protein